MKFYVLFPALAAYLAACGDGSGLAGTAPDISYELGRSFTGATTNVLSFDFPEGSGYLFSLSGDGVAASVPLGELLPLQDRIDLSYVTEGKYELELAIVQTAGTPYLDDTLSWTYSTKVPASPIVAFTELATRDTAVTMTISGSREADTNEIWVEGDLSGPHASGGFWDDLSASGLYLLTVTPEDGVKTMSVKLRNVYGNESAAVTASILKKTTSPTGCDAILAGSGSASSTIGVQLVATNDGPLFYNVFGDVKEVKDFQSFVSGETVDVEVGGAAGVKNLTIMIRDLAGNSCEPLERTVTLSEGYVTQSVEVEGAAYWTESTSVDLLLQYDHFPDAKPIEMKLTGNVAGANADTWIPFQERISVDLMPGAGNKDIYARFRDKTLTETFLVSTRIFLSPSVSVATAGDGSRSVVISRILGATAHTITGCAETYADVAYEAAYACTPNAATVAVTYTFEDATSLTLTATP
jgi:hypothetical protein